MPWPTITGLKTAITFREKICPLYSSACENRLAQTGLQPVWQCAQYIAPAAATAVPTS